LKGYGIVKILGICRVYRKGRCLSEVPSVFYFLLAYLLRNSISFFLHFRREAQRKPILCEYGVHFRIVFTLLSQYIGDLPHRVFSAFGPVGDGYLYFLAVLRAI